MMNQPSFGPMDEAEVEILNTLKDENATEADKRGALVEEILNRYSIKTLNDTQEILWYENGIYKSGGKEKIIAELQELGGYDITNHMRNEVIETIRAKTFIARSEFDKDPFWITLANGLLNISTGEFKDHSSTHLSAMQLPVTFDPKATCRPVIEFLYDILPDPRDVPLVLEYLAYCLFVDKDLQKELMLVGPPDMGKSRLLDLITAFLGKNNISNITMQQLSTNRFALAQLFGKMANIYADISHARLEDIERFKAIATADELEAEKKGMQLFKFRPRAKLIFSANIPPRPPITVDESYYRRWMLIQCSLRDKHYFSRQAIVKDPQILNKLATPENLSGLLNLVLISARRLLKRQRFCKVTSTEETRELYDRISNPAQMWIEECCEDEPDSYVEINAGYKSYLEFCQGRKMGATTKEWLGKELTRLGYLSDQKRIDGKQKRVWIGLKLRESVTRNPPFPSLENKKDDVIVETGKEPLPVTVEASR